MFAAIRLGEQYSHVSYVRKHWTRCRDAWRGSIKLADLARNGCASMGYPMASFADRITQPQILCEEHRHTHALSFQTSIPTITETHFSIEVHDINTSVVTDHEDA